MKQKTKTNISETQTEYDIKKKLKNWREVENRLAVTAWDGGDNLDWWWMLGLTVRAWVGDEIESEWELGPAVRGKELGAAVLESEWDCVSFGVSKIV